MHVAVAEHLNLVTSHLIRIIIYYLTFCKILKQNCFRCHFRNNCGGFFCSLLQAESFACLHIKNFEPIFIGRDPKAEKHSGIHQRSNKSLLLVAETTLLIFLWKDIISLSKSSFSKLHTLADIEMCIHLLFPEIS